MYTRVFASILDSSINLERIPPSVRWLWVTMLLIADGNRTGIVDMPVERLASKAGLSVTQTKEGLAILSAPDAESTSDEEDGRRLIPIREDAARGWKLVNWEKYHDIANAEQQRTLANDRLRKFRSKKRNETPSNADETGSNTSEASTNTTADTKTLEPLATKKPSPSSPKKETSKDLVENLTLTGKQLDWCAAKAPSINPDEELEAFKERMRANGYTVGKSTVKDAWSAFQTQMRNAEKWHKQEASRGGREPGPTRSTEATAPAKRRLTAADFGARFAVDVLEEERLRSLQSAPTGEPHDPV